MDVVHISNGTMAKLLATGVLLTGAALATIDGYAIAKSYVRAGLSRGQQVAQTVANTAPAAPSVASIWGPTSA